MVMDGFAQRDCIRENGCLVGAATAVWISMERKPIGPTTVFGPSALETKVYGQNHCSSPLRVQNIGR
jgi:hypothetical protein